MDDRLSRITRAAVFLLAAAVFILACFAVWTGVENANERQAAIAQRDAAARRVDHLITNLRQQEADAAAERAQLEATQADLLGKYGRLETSERHLLRWLRAHGISVPARFVAPPSVVRVEGPHARKPKHRARSAPAAPPTAPSPEPPTLPNGKPAPGNSGNAPGHNKPGHK